MFKTCVKDRLYVEHIRKTTFNPFTTAGTSTLQFNILLAASCLNNN